MILALSISAQALAFDHGHKDWETILNKFVIFKEKQSFFNYSNLKQSKELKLFNQYLQSLSAVEKNEFNKFSQDEKLAFLINLYNAFTVKLIIDHYPVKSIKKIGSFFSSPWKIKFIKFQGKNVHLDAIEHDMIRQWFKEPRIHFAVNCASISCPSLFSKPFIATKLEQQLEKATQHFMGHRNKNYYDNKKKVLKISKIFNWYGDDFNQKFGSVKKFLLKYIKAPNDVQEIEYLSYDWGLNETEN